MPARTSHYRRSNLPGLVVLLLLASLLGGSLPPALARILLKLLRRDPAERYPSASRLLEDLGRASGHTLAASPSPAGTLLASQHPQIARPGGPLWAD